MSFRNLWGKGSPFCANMNTRDCTQHLEAAIWTQHLEPIPMSIWKGKLRTNHLPQLLGQKEAKKSFPRYKRYLGIYFEVQEGAQLLIILSYPGTGIPLPLQPNFPLVLCCFEISVKLLNIYSCSIKLFCSTKRPCSSSRLYRHNSCSCWGSCSHRIDPGTSAMHILNEQ